MLCLECWGISIFVVFTWVAALVCVGSVVDTSTPGDEPTPNLVMMDVDRSGPGFETKVGVIYIGARMMNDIGMCLNTK